MAASPRQAQALTFSAASQGTTTQKQLTDALDARVKQQRDKDAAFRLGLAYTRGYFGLKVDLEKAKDYLRIALDRKDGDTEEDRRVARAAEKFCFDNKNILGEELITEDGDGTKELKKGDFDTLDYVPSKFLYAEAVHDGNISQAIKQRDAADPERGEKSRKNVVKKMTECSTDRFTPATGFLGRLHCEGYGIDQDVSKGLSLLAQAANAGDAQSSLYLGKVYQKGLHGVEPSLQAARTWYSAANKQGITEAKTELDKVSKLIRKAAGCVLL